MRRISVIAESTRYIDALADTRHINLVFMGTTLTIKPADQALPPWLLSSLLSKVFLTLLPMNVETSVTHQFEYVFTKNFKTFIHFYFRPIIKNKSLNVNFLH